MKGNIIRFNQMAQQTVGDTTKIMGLVKVRDITSIIDDLNLEANPRSSKTNNVTDAIQNSLSTSTDLFPFKTKGILLASSEYELLDRGRIIIKPKDRAIEGILDGGHNTLAIGLFILRSAMAYAGQTLAARVKKWDQFKEAWNENRSLVDIYFNHLDEEHDTTSGMDTLVPVELLVPRDAKDDVCATRFRNNLMEICNARNTNVQLSLVAKDNQSSLFDELKEVIEAENPFLKGKIEWKPNEGTGEIKVQDIVALTWIPLTLVEGIEDENGKVIQPPSLSKLYTSKGSCLSQYDKFMTSRNVTEQSGDDYKRILVNEEVQSAFKVAALLPKLYDFLYEIFPSAYNRTGGKYGRINTVKSLNERRTRHVTPFQEKEVEFLNPDGFMMPLICSSIALMERKEIGDGSYAIAWKVRNPIAFYKKNADKIVEKYKGLFDVCDYDPQKIGKQALSYTVVKGAVESIVRDEQLERLINAQK